MAKPKTTKDLKKYSKEVIREAERVSALASKYRQEYIDLLMPYDGKPWSEIPIATLEKAEKAMKKAQSYDKQYCKLMGI